MPIFFLIVGVLLIVVAINNKITDLGDLVKEDFRPSDNSPSFVLWLLAIFVAGAFGYIKPLKPVANAFLVLICVAMILSNKGFFANFKKAVEG